METKKEYISKNKLIIRNYCKHGDLEIGTKNWNLAAKLNRNLCHKCSDEILNSDDFREDAPGSEVLMDRNGLIRKKLLRLWYPYLFKKIDRIKAKYWKEKIYLFINKMDSPPICKCGNPISFTPITRRAANLVIGVMQLEKVLLKKQIRDGKIYCKKIFI